MNPEPISIPSSRPRLRRWLLVVSLLILLLGAVEDLYGNTDDGDVYGSDAVQYLDIARAIQRHDWHSALNPLWSQGYPALLAVERPLFPAGPGGDWDAIRTLNFAIFAANYAAFLFLMFTLVGTISPEGSPKRQRRSWLLWTGGLSLFLASQICLGQVSRVNPDELVTTCFFLACALLVRLLRHADRPVPRGLLLGLVLGVGFVVKAVFLALGASMLLMLTIALWQRRHSWSPVLRTVGAAGLVFATIVGSYGAALSHATGYRTLGEAGSLNYAWHVNRLQKWVHWEGGLDPASKAWPKASVARFAQWETDPPDLGAPIHPSRILQRDPTVYSFSAPFHATYAPYYNPAYWYVGYKHVVRPRYQLIAIAKSLTDLAQVLLKQPVLYTTLLAFALLLGTRAARRAGWSWLRSHWLVPAWALLAVAIYVPVHLEGRYLAGFLALLALCSLLAGTADTTALTPARTRLIAAVLLLGVAADVVVTQRPVWRNLAHRRSPRDNEEWRIGEAVLAQHLPPMSQVGVLAWTASLHSDWAYIAHLQITSEVASGPDLDLFWRQTPEVQSRTIDAFRKAGAVAVFTRGKPASATDPGWQRMGDTSMWMLRLEPDSEPANNPAAGMR